MSESASQEHPDAETTESDLAAADEAAETTQLLPPLEAGPTPALRRISHPAWGLVAVVAAFAVAGVTYLAFPKSPGNAEAASAASGKTSATIPGPMPGAPKTPVVHVSGPIPSNSASVPQAKGPTALRPSNPTLVKSWNAGSGGKALQQVTAESGNVLMAHAGKQYADMLRYCKALSSAVGTAQQTAPIQDAGMQKEYAAALTSFKQGATHCMSGINQVADGVEDTRININQTELDATVSDLSAGVTDLYVATEALRKQ
jgi:hypothetical protein